MKRLKSQKMPTMNRVILTTLVSVMVIFTLMVLFVSNYLFTKSIDNAKAEDINNATQISLSLKDNIVFMSRLLRLTQQSFAEINFR